MRFRTFAFVLLVPMLAAAQVTKATDPIKAACGPANSKFKVNTNSAAGTSALVAGKANVYIVEVQERVGFCPFGCGITVKAGMDGSWIGATSGNSFLMVPVDPGEHHLCAAWQSKLSGVRRHLQLIGFTAEAGKAYYFRTHITPGTTETILKMDFQAINADEGELLVDSSPKSISSLK